MNLGHCYRKQQRWDDAIQVYERALGLCPGQAGTYAALGFTRHLKVYKPLTYLLTCLMCRIWHSASMERLIADAKVGYVQLCLLAGVFACWHPLSLVHT